jgi:hypothetical protein
VNSAAITLCVASQRVFVVVVYIVMTQSGNFWIHPRVNKTKLIRKVYVIGDVHTRHIFPGYEAA